MCSLQDLQLSGFLQTILVDICDLSYQIYQHKVIHNILNYPFNHCRVSEKSHFSFLMLTNCIFLPHQSSQRFSNFIDLKVTAFGFINFLSCSFASYSIVIFIISCFPNFVFNQLFFLQILIVEAEVIDLRLRLVNSGVSALRLSIILLQEHHILICCVSIELKIPSFPSDLFNPLTILKCAILSLRDF